MGSGNPQVPKIAHSNERSQPWTSLFVTAILLKRIAGQREPNLFNIAHFSK
jgi:hypothetical protein